MDQLDRPVTDLGRLPEWLPVGVRHYLAHTEAGLPIRELARIAGCHASTVLRQIRRFESRRDDPLIDAALRKLGAGLGKPVSPIRITESRGTVLMSAKLAPSPEMVEDLDLAQDAVRVLRRLCETGAVLAVAVDMERAIVVRDSKNGGAQRTAVADRKLAEYLALREWIATEETGRVARYRITPAGRMALQYMVGEEELPETEVIVPAAPQFADQHRQWDEKQVEDPETGQHRKVRYNLAESPLTALARRRDKNGEFFLDDALVAAGERLREDFELAQMGARITQNWDRFLVGGDRGGFAPDSGVGSGPDAARQRVAHALSDLGPGLADVVLRCCCFLEGLETAEKRLGWSARSGKIVLRIALQRLRRHYDETTGPGGGLIG